MRYLQTQIKGYRSLADVTLDLHPLTVMIGPNGCGKTSLLEVFQLLKEAARGNLKDTIASLGGLNAFLTHTSDSPTQLEIAFQSEVNSPHGSGLVTYHFALEPTSTGFRIASDRFMLPSSADSPPTPYESRLGTRELLLAIGDHAVVSVLRDALSDSLCLGFLDISQRAPIRLPQTLSPATHPGRNGENLFAALYNLRESKVSRSSYERIEETLHLAFPDFDHVELPVVGGGQITLAWYEKNLTLPLYPNQLSEGTLRFLWLTTILLSPEPPPLILIDEPEVSLHPELLQIMAALLRDASARTQLLVATHSSDLIRWLRADEVVVIDKQDGKSRFTWADDPSLNLEEWLKEYTLADLWFMGNLGGRP